MEPTNTPSVKNLCIVIAITKSNWGGAQRYVHDLAVALHAQGHHVHVVLGGTGELAQKLRDGGIDVSSVPTLTRDITLTQEIRSFIHIYKVLRTIRPDVLHLNSSKAGGLGALAGRVLGVPRIIFTAHGWAFNEPRSRFVCILLRTLYWITILLAHRTIAVSAATARDIIHLPFMRSRIEVIHVGCTSTAILPRNDARRALEQMHPSLASIFSSNAKVFVTIAELHPIKGHHVMLEAFSRTQMHTPSMYWVLMGDGELRDELQTTIKKWNLNEKVLLLGHVRDASRYLNAFDYFGLPSLSEGLAYVLLEAGLANLPVIATCVGGIPEVITDGKTGLLVPSKDASALEKALTTLIADTHLAYSLGSALNTQVRTNHSLAQMVARIVDVYHNQQFFKEA